MRPALMARLIAEGLAEISAFRVRHELQVRDDLVCNQRFDCHQLEFPSREASFLRKRESNSPSDLDLPRTLGLLDCPVKPGNDNQAWGIV